MGTSRQLVRWNRRECDVSQAIINRGGQQIGRRRPFCPRLIQRICADLRGSVSSPRARRFERETVEATPIERRPEALEGCPAPLAGCMLRFDGLNASDKLSTASRSRSGLRGGIGWDLPLAWVRYDVSLRSTSTQPALARRESARICGSFGSTARIGVFQNVCPHRRPLDSGVGAAVYWRRIRQCVRSADDLRRRSRGCDYGVWDVKSDGGDGCTCLYSCFWP